MSKNQKFQKRDTMRSIIFTLLLSLVCYILAAQRGKPLHPPSPNNLNLKQEIPPITTSLMSIPKAERTVINAVNYHPLPPIMKRMSGNSNLKVVEISEKGLPIMIKGNLRNVPKGRDIALQTFDYLNAVKSAIKIKSPKEEFAITERKTDELGQVHFKMQQQYEGIKVYGGMIWLHGSAGKIGLFNGRYYPTPLIKNTQPTISQAAAQEIANQSISGVTSIKKLSNLEQKLIGEMQEPELVIYHTPKAQTEHLAWHLHLYPNVGNQWEYFIDAHSGAILNTFKTLCQLHPKIDAAGLPDLEKDHPHYSEFLITDGCDGYSSFLPPNGPAKANAFDLNNHIQEVNSYEIDGNFFLIDASRAMFNAARSDLPHDPVGAIWTIDATNTSPTNLEAVHVVTNNSWNDPLPVSAHSNAAVAYNYFKNTFGRNSINDRGGTIISVVNVADEDGGGLENAFWSGAAMYYGNGGNAFLPLAKSLDVAAHEMSHGVIQNTANLTYQGESGALNESFADIFGILVDRDDWQLGEEVVNPNIFRTGALRDMRNPNNGGTRLGDPGYQPAHVSEQYRGQEDNGGVHINSGIVNRAFYLFASNNSVGKDKAEKVYYRALTTYLVNSSRFVDLRASIIQSATDLYGANSSEVTAAISAFDGVGILGSNTGGGSQSGGATEVEVEPNPGSDFVVYTDDTQTNLYVADGQGNELVNPFSTSGILSKPSITDDGSAIVFIAADKTMHVIFIDWASGGTYEEQVLDDNPVWRNVAVARDGSRIAALADELNNEIWVYDFTLKQWAVFQLYNPTFTEGITTGDVLYADVIEFDFTGEYVMYDAFNSIRGNFGANDIEYWDISFIKIYDGAINDYEQNVTNNISKLFTGLPENVSIGNPTFSKNSPNIIAFDYIDNFEGVYDLIGVNISTGDVQTIFQNNDLNFPNYGRLDDRIIFNAQTNNGNNVVAIRALQEDKISPVGDPAVLISQTPGAQLGVWFSDGTRQLVSSNKDLEKAVSGFKIFPNPFSSDLTLEFALTKKKDFLIEVYNSLGQLQLSKTIIPQNGNNTFQIETSSLSVGTYFINLKSKDGMIARKAVKWK